MTDSKKLKSILDSEEWQHVSKIFQEAMDSLKEEQEEFWNSLSKDDQLKAFCAVSRRIHEGEINDRRSYRGVLYDVFDFGMEAYAAAQCAGYLDIHNTLYDGVHHADSVKQYNDALHKIASMTTDENILAVIKEVTNQ